MPQYPEINSAFFNTGELRVHYATWGKGKHCLIAFHGFGRTHGDFIRFTRPLKDVFTVYAMDIFFHGESHISGREPDSAPLSVNEFQAFVLAFMDHIGCDKAWLMGYSLGGRLAMKIAELLPKRVAGLYLFAPDGLVVNRWYALLSHYAAGRVVFRFFKKHNAVFFNMLSALEKSGVLSSRFIAFVRGQVATTEMQEQVYNTWTFLRNIEPDLKKLAREARQYHIPIDLFFGSYDTIIPVKNARKLKRHFPELNLHVLRSGHMLLTGANGELIWRDGLMRLPGQN